MVSHSTSSSYSLVARSTSHSDDLSAATDSLESIHYKIGRVQKERLGKTRQEAPASKRTRSLSHFSLKRQFHKNRTYSDVTLVESRKKRFRSKFDHLRNRIRSLKREEIALPPDEIIDKTDLSGSEPGQPLQRFSKEERKAFLFRDSSESIGLNRMSEEESLPVEFDGPMHKIFKNFLNVEQAKRDAIDVNAEMIGARDEYRSQKKGLKRKLENSISSEEKEALNQKLQQLEPIKGRWIRHKNGRDLEAEQLKILNEPRLRVSLPPDQKGLFYLEADFFFSVVPTTIQFTLHKEGLLKYGFLGMLEMDLQKSLV